MSKFIQKVPDDYTSLLTEVKERVRSAQYAALKAVNKELVTLYWDIGKMVTVQAVYRKTHNMSLRARLRAWQSQSHSNI